MTPCWLALSFFPHQRLLPPPKRYTDVSATLTVASINDDISKKRSHQRVHFQLRNASQDTPARLKRPTKLTWRLFLRVFTSLLAGGSSQLTQRNLKQQSEAVMKTGALGVHRVRGGLWYNDSTLKWRVCFHVSPRSLQGVTTIAFVFFWGRFSSPSETPSASHAVSFQCHCVRWDRWSNDCNRSPLPSNNLLPSTETA